MTELTLVFLVDEARVLLAMKKKGFGAGKYNGLGGKIEPGETEEQAMVREAQEEAFVTPLNFKYVADITFDEFYGTKKTVNHAHVYLCYEWEGEPKESEEMIPEWFDKDSLPPPRSTGRYSRASRAVRLSVASQWALSSPTSATQRCSITHAVSAAPRSGPPRSGGVRPIGTVARLPSVP